ncbi:hypothetical protein H311_03294 [Anncaliia algerae PRA109]|nr:hypothetical protein H311_03294 [Anncaliia algerae PRA109]
MSQYKQLIEKAEKLFNPPWYKKYLGIDYYEISDLYMKAYKQASTKEEKIFCLQKAATSYDLCGVKFDAAECYYNAYKLNNERDLLVQSTNSFYKLKAYSVAASKRGELIEEIFASGKSKIVENKENLHVDLDFVLDCYQLADMPINSRKYYFYKGYLLFIDNKKEESKKCFKNASKVHLVKLLEGNKEEFIPNDWIEEEICSKSKRVLDIL